MDVKAHYRKGRGKPYEARWWVDRRMRSRFFATEKERNQFIREFQREIGRSGEEVFKIDPARQRRWQEADAIVPHVDPVALAEFWVKSHGEGDQIPFAQGVSAYLQEMRRAGRDSSYQDHAAKALERFASHVGSVPLLRITAIQVSDFLHDLPFEPLTKANYRSYLVAAFQWFLRQGWARSNPASAVANPKVKLPEPGILTVPETEALFRANEKADPEICGLLALGAFAGLRSSAIARLSHEELDFQGRAILTPAAKTKKGRRQFIEGLPDNLWAWLRRTPAAAFQMSPREIARRREAAFARAGLLVTKAAAKASKGKLAPKAPPKNCLRHSFVSYHVALHRDPGKTALLVSHKDQAILWEHYLGVVTRDDGERYFEIRPTR